MPEPASFLQHLRESGYHPRSDKHSNALCSAIVHDLISACPLIARLAGRGELVYALNMDLKFQTAVWNVDLVLGTPPAQAETRGAPIARVTPATVQIAIEVKGVMTEHRKAVKNRKRDFEAHHEHVHNYSRDAIAGAFMVINAASHFQSPLRAEPTVHGTPARVAALVAHCVNEMRNVTETGGGSGYGVDAKGVLVVEFDNMEWSAARYLGRAPAPGPGDPLHYDSFIQRLCAEYTRRFGQRESPTG